MERAVLRCYRQNVSFLISEPRKRPSIPDIWPWLHGMDSVGKSPTVFTGLKLHRNYYLQSWHAHPYKCKRRRGSSELQPLSWTENPFHYSNFPGNTKGVFLTAIQPPPPHMKSFLSRAESIQPPTFEVPP